MDLLVGLIVMGIMLSCGFFIGRWQENKHLLYLDEKEQEFKDFLVTDLKTVPPGWDVEKAFLVCGNVVIATDYFKVFAAGLRNFFGGEIRSYETLMDRGRREATLRMMMEAREQGASVVWNIRIETSTLQGKQQKKPGGLEMIAYGTALKVRD